MAATEPPRAVARRGLLRANGSPPAPLLIPLITVPACRWHHSVEMICGLQRGGEGHDRCQTVVDGRYATVVTIYNPPRVPRTITPRRA
jgi:hypothetical protein